MKHLTPLLSAGLFGLVLTVGSPGAVAQTGRTVLGSGAVVAQQSDMRIVGTVGQAVAGVAFAAQTEGTFGFWSGAAPKTSAVAGDVVSQTAAFGLTAAPNPVSGRVTISFIMPEESDVTLTLFNDVGTPMRRLLDERRPAGNVSIQTDLKGLPSGSYTGVLNIGDDRATVRLIVVD